MTDQNPQTAALHRAIDLAGGTQAALANKLGFTQQAISEWVAAGRVSRHGAMLVETVVGIPRHELRPDLFAAPPTQDAA